MLLVPSKMRYCAALDRWLPRKTERSGRGRKLLPPSEPFRTDDKQDFGRSDEQSAHLARCFPI